MSDLALNQIQGIILRTYGTKREARYYFLTIQNAVAARQWISNILPQVTLCDTKNDGCYLNIAFSLPGLKKLGVPDTITNSFSEDFISGALDEHTLRMLGDFGVNDPQNWFWGNKSSAADIHVLLTVFASDTAQLEQYCTQLEQNFSATGLSTFIKFDTHLNNDNREHFGFRDGIAQPAVEGFGRKDVADNTIKPGEFIFNYQNEYDIFPESPLVAPLQDPENLLQVSKSNSAMKDLGADGSYVVFRQIEEDSKAFWTFIQKTVAENPHGTASKGLDYLGAKMVGRWPDGSPVTLFDDAPYPAMADLNNFAYAQRDYFGFRCPIGAHIRRVNPRDSFNPHAEALSDKKEKKAIESSIRFLKKHRLIRRSRPYGKPIAESMNAADILASPVTDKDRGIYFICMQANLSRQFEFIQQTWVSDPKLNQFYADPDPFLGSPAQQALNKPSGFSAKSN